MPHADQMLANAASHAADLAAPHLSPRPSRRVAVLACMDTRLDLFRMLGLKPGDAHIIRNAGGLVTDDALRSLRISQQLLETEEVVVVMHENCGLQGADPAEAPGAFTDLEATLRESLDRLRSSELPHRDHVRGFVFDPETGDLREVR